jgi:PAS domain S-box-containing protein
VTATILIIDDSEDDQRLYQRAFKDFDSHFSLGMVSSAEAGLECVAHARHDRSPSRRPDLILIDYNLPDMDGLSLMKKLAEYPEAIPVVMLTGESSTAVAVEAMKRGADDYIVKDTEGRYLRLLPRVAKRVLAAHSHREQTLRLQQETEMLLRRNQTLMHNAMDGIHVLDVQGNLVEANDAFCRMLGYTREEITGFNVADWNAQSSVEELRERFKKLIGKSTLFETVYRRKDGSLINVEISVSNMEIEGRHLFFAASRDITERKHAEEELKLRAQLLDSTTDSVFLVDLDGNFVYVNEAAWKSRGYTRDELMAMNVRELTTPEFSKLVATRMKELLENGHVVIESRHRCKDGSIISVEVSSRVIESCGRKLILSSSRDITERKKTEAMLMRHKLVIDTSIDGFWVTDKLGNLREANEAYAKMSGYSVEELVGMHISQLEAIEQTEDVRAHVAKIEAQGYDRFETRHRRKDGHEIDIEISVTYIAEPAQLVVFCRDITERKRVSQELQYKQHLLNEAQRLGKLGSWELDLLSGVLRWSDEMYRIFELEPARFPHSYEGFLGVIHPDDRDMVNQAYTQSLLDRQPYDVVHRLLFGDGRIKWVREHCSSEFDVSGKPLRSVGMTQDITERMETEAALLQGEANLRAMLDNSPYMTWLKDDKGRYVAINKMLADYWGLADASEAIGKTDLDLQPKELAEKHRADDAKVMAARQRKTVEESAFDGKNTHWVEIFKTPIIDAHDNVLGTVGFARDITERKKVEHKLLLESEAEHRRAEVLAQQFGQLLRSSFNEIYLFDAESLRFLQVSEGAKKNLGYSGDELQQLTPLDLKPSFTRKSFGKLLAPLTGGKQQTLLFETVHRRKDGTTYPVEVRLQLIVQEPRIFVAVVQDITERQRAENQLREFATHLQNVREEEKTCVARDIHDDLGGTLTALKLDAHWLADQLGANGEKAPLLERAKSMCALLDTAVHAVRRIINDLRPAILDDFGLTAAIKWQCAQFQQRTGIECRTVCIDDEDDVRGNELDKAVSVNLFRIAQEALTNVVRHSGASRVEIQLQRSDEEIVLSVCDNGRGIPEGQTVAATSHGMRGMCERVKHLDGRIKFDSPPGGGLCLIVTIPQPKPGCQGNQRLRD